MTGTETVSGMVASLYYSCTFLKAALRHEREEVLSLNITKSTRLIISENSKILHML